MDEYFVPNLMLYIDDLCAQWRFMRTGYPVLTGRTLADVCADFDVLCADRECPFSDNSRSGFNYMCLTLFGVQCKSCQDRKAFQWMDDFTACWLYGKPIPEFDEACWLGQCDGRVTSQGTA